MSPQQNDLYLVYSMTKSASVTAHAALNRAVGRGAEVRHVHCMGHWQAGEMQKIVSRDQPTSGTNQLISDPLADLRRQIDYAQEMTERVSSARAGGRRICVVSGVREPVAQALSAFFNHLSCFFPDYLRYDAVHQNFERILADVFRSYLDAHALARPPASPLERLLQGHLFLCTDWFERELDSTLGVDVFASPFDHERGFVLHSQPGMECLVYRCEQLHEALDAGLRRLTHQNNLTLGRRNAADQKPYGDLYNRVRDTLWVDEKTLDALYATPYMAHFYTPPEIERFRGKWAANGASRQRGT